MSLGGAPYMPNAPNTLAFRLFIGQNKILLYFCAHAYTSDKLITQFKG